MKDAPALETRAFAAGPDLAQAASYDNARYYVHVRILGLVFNGFDKRLLCGQTQHSMFSQNLTPITCHDATEPSIVSSSLFGNVMYRILMIIAALFIVISTNQQSHAQSKDTVASLISCLHEAPLPTENADGDEYLQCYSKVSYECDELHPPGGSGPGVLAAENCFLSVAEQIKSKMYSHLENGWPDKNSTDYQLRKLAIDYGIKRSELSCEFLDAINNISNKPWLGEVDQRRLNYNNKFAALCLSSFIAGNYWTIIVHEQMR